MQTTPAMEFLSSLSHTSNKRVPPLSIPPFVCFVAGPADGPLRGVVSIASGTGEVRGYVGSPMLGEMPLPDAVGTTGAVQIVKNHPDWPRPYNGITAIRHGDIDRDIGTFQNTAPRTQEYGKEQYRANECL